MRRSLHARETPLGPLARTIAHPPTRTRASEPGRRAGRCESTVTRSVDRRDDPAAGRPDRPDRGGLAGADGCRDGWIVATRDGVKVVPRLAPELAGLLHLGIDMPIGLPATPGRSADRAARTFVGARRSSVFPAPARPILGHSTHEAANAASRAAFGSGLPVQTFHLFDKIREVDDLVRSLPEPDRATRVIEVHPECSFRAMTGRELPPKRSAEGRDARRRAVTAEFGPPPPVPRGAALDDMYDAFAVLWSVERFARGDHLALPATDPPETDAVGIVMRIVV